MVTIIPGLFGIFLCCAIMILTIFICKKRRHIGTRYPHHQAAHRGRITGRTSQAARIATPVVSSSTPAASSQPETLPNSTLQEVPPPSYNQAAAYPSVEAPPSYFKQKQTPQGNRCEQHHHTPNGISTQEPNMQHETTQSQPPSYDYCQSQI